MTERELKPENGIKRETFCINKEVEKQAENGDFRLNDKEEKHKEINDEIEAMNGGAPVDRGWAWVILVACVFEIIIYGGLLRSLGVFFLRYQTRFQSNASETALMSLIQNVVLSVTVIFVMTVGLKKFSSRVSVFIGGVFTVAAYMITGFATDIKVFYFALGLLGGIGMAMIHSPMLAVIGVYFHKHRGLANSVFNGGGSVGGLIFAPIIVKIFEEYQFSGAMLIFSGLLMNICVSALVLRPIETYQKKRKFIDEVADITEQENLLQIDRDKANKSFERPKLNLNGVKLEAGLFLSDNKLNRKQSSLTKSNESTLKNNLEPKFIDHPLKGSPLLQRVRAYSVGIRQRTLSEHNQRYDSESNLHHKRNPIKGVIDAISRSQVALYASSNGMYGSIIDVDTESGNIAKYTKAHDKKGDKESVQKTESSVGCGSSIKSCILSVLCTVFDLRLLRNPVFITYLFMAFSIHAGLHLVPIFMPAHAKDIGISNEKIGLLISLTMVIDLVSKVTVGVIADRKLIRTPIILTIVSLVMGTASHLVRFVNSFTSLMVFVVVVGMCCGQYMSLFGVVLMEVIGPEQFKSSLGFGQLVHGATIAIFFPVSGLLRDVTGSYVASYHLLGSLTYLAGALAFIIPIVNRRRGEKTNKNMNDSSR